MRVLLEWGPAGAQAYGDSGHHGGSRLVARVVVDTLSFTTAVSVAADRGIEVLPYRWADASAATFATARGATLAVGRSQAAPGQVSLSPSSLRAAEPSLRRVVLPSPNGSTISAALGDLGCDVVAGCLRNRTAVASYLLSLSSGPSTTPDVDVLVVPAGERWPDGSLRPAIEDLWGAGAVVAALQEAAGADSAVLVSQEAAAAAASYRLVADRLEEAMFAVVSGQELAATGFADDVTVAAELDASDVVPVLRDGAFRPADLSGPQ